MKPVYVMITIGLTLLTGALIISIPHPYRNICLYEYKTTFETFPQQIIKTYNIVKMPTVCVNMNDEGFARTTRTTIDERYDTIENRKRLESKLKNLINKRENK
jgi:hypothetical protein